MRSDPGRARLEARPLSAATRGRRRHARRVEEPPRDRGRRPADVQWVGQPGHGAKDASRRRRSGPRRARRSGSWQWWKTPRARRARSAPRRRTAAAPSAPTAAPRRPQRSRSRRARSVRGARTRRPASAASAPVARARQARAPRERPAAAASRPSTDEVRVGAVVLRLQLDGDARGAERLLRRRAVPGAAFGTKASPRSQSVTSSAGRFRLRLHASSTPV